LKVWRDRSRRDTGSDRRHHLLPARVELRAANVVHPQAEVESAVL